MGLTVSLADGRTACADSVTGFVDAAEAFTELELLDVSRCHGWTRLDVVVHVIAGWHEMLTGLVSPTDDAPTVDAASYWRAFAADVGDDDPVDVLMAQRRRTAAYARPASAVAQLRDVAAAVRRGVDATADRPLRWQGHVFAPGDFLAAWAVEDVVHQLDLRGDAVAPASALRVARATVEALLGSPLPAGWSDADATLAGAGRAPAPTSADALDENLRRLPVLG